MVSIITYDLNAQLAHHRYVIEKGERYYPHVTPLVKGGLRDYLIETGQALVINKDMEQAMQPFGGLKLPFPEPPCPNRSSGSP